MEQLAGFYRGREQREEEDDNKQITSPWHLVFTALPVGTWREKHCASLQLLNHLDVGN